MFTQEALTELLSGDFRNQKGTCDHCVIFCGGKVLKGGGLK